MTASADVGLIRSATTRTASAGVRRGRWRARRSDPGIGRRRGRFDRCRHLIEERAATDAQRIAGDPPDHTVAGPILELLHREGLGAGRRDGGRDRMLRPGLERGGQDLEPAVVGLGSDHVDQFHAALGDRAGLVQDQGVDPAAVLEDLATLDDDAQLGAPAGAHHDRQRRGEPEGAGAGDDQDGDGRSEGLVRRMAGQEPSHQREERDGDGGRNEDRGYTVGQPLHRRSAALRLRHQVHDLRQGRFGADSGGLDHEVAVGVDGGTNDLVASGHLDGNGFAGDHRRVHGGVALDHRTVGGDLLAGSNGEAHAHLEGLDGDLLATLQTGGPGPQLGEGTDGVARSPGGPGLEPLAQQHERTSTAPVSK